MMLGLSRCTPPYIRRMESGRQKLKVEATSRASNYLITILKMGDEFWPTICLKAEMKNWENGNASVDNEIQSGFKMEMRTVGDGETIRGWRERMDPVRLLTKMGDVYKNIENQTMQED